MQFVIELQKKKRRKIQNRTHLCSMTNEICNNHTFIEEEKRFWLQQGKRNQRKLKEKTITGIKSIDCCRYAFCLILVFVYPSEKNQKKLCLFAQFVKKLLPE